jgi:hypothetical protein
MSGVKDDQEKAPIYRGIIASFPRAVEEVARAGAYGANYYSWDNWRNVSDGINRYSDALLRHITEEAKGEIYDPRSRLLHAGSVAWNALARLELILEQTADARQIKEYYDDRTEQVRPEGQEASTKTQPYSPGPSNDKVQATCVCKRTEAPRE